MADEVKSVPVADWGGRGGGPVGTAVVVSVGAMEKEDSGQLENTTCGPPGRQEASCGYCPFAR